MNGSMTSKATTNQDTNYVDINNLSLTGESLEGFNPDAELYTQPPPVPDGTYTCRLSFNEEDPAKQWVLRKGKTNGKPYYSTQVRAEIIDTNSPFYGRIVFDNFVSTMVFENSGTSKIAAIIKAVGGFDTELAQVKTHEDLVRLFSRVLASEPTLRVVTRWEATEKRPDGSYNTFLKGMRSFPEDANGNYQHIVEGPDSGDDITARATISRYLGMR